MIKTVQKYKTRDDWKWLYNSKKRGREGGGAKTCTNRKRGIRRSFTQVHDRHKCFNCLTYVHMIQSRDTRGGGHDERSDARPMLDNTMRTWKMAYMYHVLTVIHAVLK